MYKARYIVTLSFLLWHTAAGADPVVQLSHGGQLKGKSLTYNNTDVVIFLGMVMVLRRFCITHDNKQISKMLFCIT